MTVEHDPSAKPAQSTGAIVTENSQAMHAHLSTLQGTAVAARGEITSKTEAAVGRTPPRAHDPHTAQVTSDHEAHRNELHGQAARHAAAKPADAHGPAPHAPAPTTHGDPHGAIEFKKVDDWNAHVPPPKPDEDPRERAHMLALAKQKVAHDRAEATKLLQNLRTVQLRDAAAIRGMKPALQNEIATSQRAALGRVAGAEAAGAASVQSHIAGLKAGVSGTAAAMTAQVTAAHTQALAKIDQALQAATQKVTADHQTEVAKLTTELTATESTVKSDFHSTETSITALGAAKATEASGLGNSVQFSYPGDKQAAARKAAVQVAEKYSAAMPSQASSAVSQIHGQLDGALKTTKHIQETAKTKLDDGLKHAKSALKAAHTTAVQKANQAAQAAKQQIHQSSTTSIAQLSSLQTSSIASVHGQAASARTGINGAASAGIANVAHRCDQLAANISLGPVGLIEGAKNVETPDVKALRAKVTGAIAEMGTSVAASKTGLQKQAAGMAGGVTSQGNSSATGIAAAAAGANASASQMAAGADQSLHKIGDAAKKGLEKSAQDFAHQATQLAQGAHESFTGTGKEAKTAFTGITDNVASKLKGALQQVTTGFNDAVPKKETADILANAQKAADKTPEHHHWWQSVLSFVIKVVIAVAVAVVVTALIAGTGGLGLMAIPAVIAIGAAGGALTSYAGQVVDNVINNGFNLSAFTNVDLKEIAISAVAGGITAGVMTGVGGLSGAAASSWEGLAGKGLLGGAVENAFAEGAGNSLGNLSIRSGVDFAANEIGHQGATFAFDGKFDLSMAGLIQTAAQSVGGQAFAGKFGGFKPGEEGSSGSGSGGEGAGSSEGGNSGGSEGGSAGGAHEGGGESAGGHAAPAPAGGNEPAAPPAPAGHANEPAAPPAPAGHANEPDAAAGGHAPADEHKPLLGEGGRISDLPVVPDVLPEKKEPEVEKPEAPEIDLGLGGKP